MSAVQRRNLTQERWKILEKAPTDQIMHKALTIGAIREADRAKATISTVMWDRLGMMLNKRATEKEISRYKPRVYHNISTYLSPYMEERYTSRAAPLTYSRTKKHSPIIKPRELAKELLERPTNWMCEAFNRDPRLKRSVYKALHRLANSMSDRYDIDDIRIISQVIKLSANYAGCVQSFDPSMTQIYLPDMERTVTNGLVQRHRNAIIRTLELCEEDILPDIGKVITPLAIKAMRENLPIDPKMIYSEGNKLLFVERQLRTLLEAKHPRSIYSEAEILHLAKKNGLRELANTDPLVIRAMLRSSSPSRNEPISFHKPEEFTKLKVTNEQLHLALTYKFMQHSKRLCGLYDPPPLRTISPLAHKPKPKTKKLNHYYRHRTPPLPLSLIHI